MVSGENSNILLTESNFEQLISEVMYAVNNRGEFTMKIIKSRKIIFVAITVTIIICLGMTIVLYQYFDNQSNIKLHLSEGNIAVKYIQASKSSTIRPNMKEILQSEVWQNENLTIFSGVIQSVQNIKIKMDDDISYNAIVDIQVLDCIRGNLEEGASISALAGCSVRLDGIWQEDSLVNSSMMKGEEGIFLIRKYDNTDTLEYENSTLYLSDIAEYGFPDAMRYSFIQGKDGEIRYCKELYNDLDAPRTLSDIKQFIKSKIL